GEAPLLGEQLRDPEVHVRVLGIELERAAQLEQRFPVLTLRLVLAGALEMAREALLVGAARGQGERAAQRRRREAAGESRSHALPPRAISSARAGPARCAPPRPRGTGPPRGRPAACRARAGARPAG